ncbi:MAG: entericidin A/B family lipoprotein [Sulfuriferula sp.]
MRKLTLLATVLMLLNLSACNTMHGLGQDVEKAGEAIQKGAK